MLGKLTKILASTTVIFAAISIILAVQLMAIPAQTALDAPLRVGGVFTIAITRNGETVSMETHNLITNIGKSQVRNLLSTLNASWPNQLIHQDNRTISMSLSDDATPLATWTKLTTEYDNTNGLGRTQGTVTLLNYTAFQVYHLWTCTGTGQKVQCCGVNFWNSLQSNNNLYCAGTFTENTLNNGDTIAVTYTLNVG